MRAQIDELRDLADYYRQCYDDAQLDEAAADLERRAAVETVLRLRKVLALDGRAADAWAAESEPVDDPADYDNLIPRIDELEFVCFTGDRDPIEDLAEHNPLATWAGKAWDAAQVLDDYARAVLEGKHSGGMDAYLRNTPSGFRGYSRKNHAATESQDVHNNPKFRQQRVFRVPIELDAYGEVPMFAHFKLVTSKMISPRLHYLDATASTGMVYIGYIGRHLDTKQTN